MLADPNIHGLVGGNGGGYTEGARVYKTSTQSLANNVVAVVTFNSVRYDTDGIYDFAVSASKLVCRTAGKYLINANIRWQANPNERRNMIIRLNGTTYIDGKQSGASPGGATEVGITTFYPLSVGDYIELLARQKSGGALNIENNPNIATVFMMQRIG